MDALFKILFVKAFFSLTLFATESLQMAQNYAKAVEKGVAQDKHIILFTKSNFCPWCIKMERETLRDNKVITLLNEKYIFLSIDVNNEKHLENLPSDFIPPGTPTTFIIDPHKQKNLFTMKGYKDAKQFFWRLDK